MDLGYEDGYDGSEAFRIKRIYVRVDPGFPFGPGPENYLSHPLRHAVFFLTLVLV